MISYRDEDALLAEGSAIAPRGRALVLTNDMMIDPFRNEATRFVDRGFRMVDAVKGRACRKSLNIRLANIPQFFVRRDDGAFALS
ncbi:hypothetical protein JCM15831A_09630 [Asaia astilbis]